MAKRHGLVFWRKHVEDWCRSDLSQREYCATHGLGERAFHRWRSREKETIAAAKATLTLVPVNVGTPATGGVVRVRSPDGWEIEMPASSVSEVVDFLKYIS